MKHEHKKLKLINDCYFYKKAPYASFSMILAQKYKAKDKKMQSRLSLKRVYCLESYLWKPGGFLATMITTYYLYVHG